MQWQDKSVQATLLMAGMIIGAGIFAIPFVFARSGVIFGVLTLVIVAAVVLATHLMYTDIILLGGGKQRLIGNARAILGENIGKLTSVLVTCGNIASLLVYMVLGGTFLHALFGRFINIPLAAYQIGFLILGAVCIGVGPALISKLNSILTAILIALFIALTFVALRGVYLPNLTAFNLSEAGSAYGVVLFSLIGINAIPEMSMLLGKQSGSLLAKTVKMGTLIAAAITLFFGVAVAGFNGPYTTQDAVTGLAGQLGMWILVVGAIVGLLAVFTSFIILALNLDETFQMDFKWSKTRAAIATIAPVLVIFLVGARDLVSIISFTGTLLGGTTCVLIALMYRKLQQTKKTAPSLRYDLWVPPACIALLVLGLLAELKSVL